MPITSLERNRDSEPIPGLGKPFGLNPLNLDDPLDKWISQCPIEFILNHPMDDKEEFFRRGYRAGESRNNKYEGRRIRIAISCTNWITYLTDDPVNPIPIQSSY